MEQSSQIQEQTNDQIQCQTQTQSQSQSNPTNTVIKEKKVKIISYSKNSIESGKSDDSLEEMVAYCARVSNPSNQQLNQNNSKLIGYLIKNCHWSPFEMVSICLEINTTRDIARQILRHRSFSFQEFSQRYAVATLGYESREARLQDTKNRQNSLETLDEELKTQWELIQQSVHEQSAKAYQWAISNGIAKEQARAVLPEGNTLSRLYMNGTLRSWIHYIQLRTGNGTQKEHRVIACECAKAIEPIFPMIMGFVQS
jgi:thymidylate synthase (FAD)